MSTTISDGGLEGGDAASVVDAPAEASTITLTLASCSAFTPCGGDVTGTWNLAAGCLADPLAASKSLCPTLVVNAETATASGSVTFQAGIVTRNYQTHYGMDITIPDACLQGGTCAQAQAVYQPYIPNTTCTATTGGCRCTGSVDTTATQGSSYTTSNQEVITAGGDHYAYCVTGGTMQYRHASGPSPELGEYTLQKE